MPHLCGSRPALFFFPENTMPEFEAKRYNRIRICELEAGGWVFVVLDPKSKILLTSKKFNTEEEAQLKAVQFSLRPLEKFDGREIPRYKGMNVKLR